MIYNLTQALVHVVYITSAFCVKTIVHAAILNRCTSTSPWLTPEPSIFQGGFNQLTIPPFLHILCDIKSFYVHQHMLLISTLTETHASPARLTGRRQDINLSGVSFWCVWTDTFISGDQKWSFCTWFSAQSRPMESKHCLFFCTKQNENSTFIISQLQLIYFSGQPHSGWLSQRRKTRKWLYLVHLYRYWVIYLVW